MKQDVLNWAHGQSSSKIISKETLNHPGLINMVSGLDVFLNTSKAYKLTYQALGIDIINRVPMRKAPIPTIEGQLRRHPKKPYYFSNLGVYDTLFRHTYECVNVEDVWKIDMSHIQYDDLIVPVPHNCQASDIRLRQAVIGETGLYYPMLYTTLFMWPVEILGWKIFLLAATLEPDRFHKHFLLPCATKSKAIVTEIIGASDSPFLFLHDDLCSSTGPMLAPSWYDRYIFPHYPEIWEEAKKQGRKIIFVADGDMSIFLERLIDLGVDGIMFENPATPLDYVIKVFGKRDLFFIGGIETVKLTMGTPGEIRQMVFDLVEKTKDCPGFSMASCGGLHGNIPMKNLEAYFDARSEVGVTLKNWRNIKDEIE